MLMLLFYLGEVMYTIKCDRVREIAPVVALRRVPHTPAYFAGFFNYRGSIVPVIDLCQLIQGRPCEMRLSTRIILVDYPRKDHGPSVMGLMAERITETIRQPDQAVVSTGVNLAGAPYLGSMVIEPKRMIQVIDLDLLPESFAFFPTMEEGLPHDTKGD